MFSFCNTAGTYKNVHVIIIITGIWWFPLNRSKLDVPSPTTSIQWENTATNHSESNDLYTANDVTDDIITYSTLKEVCIQLADLREGLPTGGWEQEPQIEEDNEL